jgi:type I restriction enzyme S subunit
VLVKTGTTVQSLKYEEFESQPIPLPPVAEQQRIVAKVDELMLLCDRLEAAQCDREARRDRLAAASHHHLNNGAKAAFRKHAHFYLGHIPRLTTRPVHIQQLRETILSLAVRSQLVPQDVVDDSAPTTQATSVRRSRVRGKQYNPDESWPYELPGSWKWHRLEAISEQITDGEHATPLRIHEQQVPLVTAKNVRDGSMDYRNTDWVSYETAVKAWRRCRPSVGDVLLVCVGATTGRLCVLNEPRDMVLVRSVALIRPSSAIEVAYLALALRSPLSQAQIWEKVKVSAQPCLYINRIKSLSIPLPPLVEQRRIVAKVNELMTLCDELGAQLTTAQVEKHRLFEAVLHQALAMTP